MMMLPVAVAETHFYFAMLRDQIRKLWIRNKDALAGKKKFPLFLAD